MEHVLLTIEQFALATLLSGAIGLERQRKARGAGLRTHILVCLGSTLLMVVSRVLVGGTGLSDQSARLAAGIITGIGFLGAGTILTVGGEQRGLTTAAMVWFVAALGIAIGAGLELIAVLATVFALAVVISLEYVEALLPQKERVSLSITIRQRFQVAHEVERLIAERGFTIIGSRVRTLEGGARTEMDFELASIEQPDMEQLAEALLARYPDAEMVSVRR
ncbi:MAG: MgtC/SapB family protein [Candidatus Hydrogenedentes bacterium]|nr:MgtC/SapB family protein [Candidatus Hydrogenedentota bacterium]